MAVMLSFANSNSNSDLHKNASVSKDVFLLHDHVSTVARKV